MPSYDKFNLNPIKYHKDKKVPKLTKKQKDHMRNLEYNKMFNELFILHKYLVECEYTTHSVSEGNPIDDAIELIEILLEEKEK